MDIFLVTMMIMVMLIAVALLHCSQASSPPSKSVYDHLVRHIKGQANPLVIPRQDAHKPLVVDFQAGWLDIQDVDYTRNEIEGILATSISWNSGISWNPSDFNGKKAVVISSRDVYHPVIGIVNVVGPLDTWNGERVILFANGRGVIRAHSRGKFFCNEELSESNSCRLRMAAYSASSDIISFMEPSERRFDLRKIYDGYYFKGSNFNLTAHSYEIHKEAIQHSTVEYMEYVFSFEKKQPNNDRRSYYYKAFF